MEWGTWVGLAWSVYVRLVWESMIAKVHHWVTSVPGSGEMRTTGLGMTHRTRSKWRPGLLEVPRWYHFIQGSSLDRRKSPNKSCFGPTTWIKPIRDWRKVYFCLRAIFCLDGNRVPRSPDLCKGNLSTFRVCWSMWARPMHCRAELLHVSNNTCLPFSSQFTPSFTYK